MNDFPKIPTIKSVRDAFPTLSLLQSKQIVDRMLEDATEVHDENIKRAEANANFQAGIFENINYALKDYCDGTIPFDSLMFRLKESVRVVDERNAVNKRFGE